jgi:IS30 family transposase
VIMNKQYTQLSSEERDRIAVLRAEGKKSSKIAQILGRNKSTICRELKRNKSSVYDVYLSHKAHERAAKRKREAAQRPRLKDKVIMCYVIEKLRLGWSPEQIAGRIPQELPGQAISHEAIYQFIYDKQTLKGVDLRPYLPRKHRKRLPRGHSRKHRNLHIPQRVSINERPAHINERLEYGHWEADTMIARQSVSSLAVLLERLSRRLHIAKLPAQSARNLRTAINRRLSRHPHHLRKSITYDNGAENVEHMLTNKVLGTQSYFCEPYHSWEKGSVEHALSLIRRFLPKKTNLDTITKEQVKWIESLLNDRPRKCLSYKTPNEVFNQAVALAP